MQEQSDGPQIHQPHQLFVMTVTQFMRYAHAAALFLIASNSHLTLRLQEVATWQQRMQADLPLAYQTAGPTGAAEQHASVMPGSSSNLHQVLEEQGASAEPAFVAVGQEMLPEQGISAVTQGPSAEQGAPVGQSTHIMGKASHQGLAPASGQQEHGTEVASRQNSWEGPHGWLRNHSSLANCANPEQVR